MWGLLNYCITRIILGITERNYEVLQGIVGLLESVKQEFYRRAVSVYEERKAVENGDLNWEVKK